MTRLETLALDASGPARATLIALPGLMESAEALLPSLLHWAAKGFDVVGINPRGHGDSPRWSPALLGRHAGDVIVEDILATLTELALDPDLPLVLFGHSAGGAAAAAVAAALPKRIGAMVLEDPFWRLPVSQFQDAAAARRASAELQRLKGTAEADRLAEITAIFPQWPRDELAAWSRAKEDTDISVVANGHIIPACGWPTLVADLKRSGIPILVATGTIRVGMTANHRAMLRASGVDVLVVRGASHFVRRDDRDGFHAVMDDFLDRYIPAAGPGGISTKINEIKPIPRIAPHRLQPLGGPSWPE